jgi:DNA ligase-4
MKGFWREGAINDDDDDNDDNDNDDEEAIDDFQFEEKQKQKSQHSQQQHQNQQQQNHQIGSLAATAARLEYDPAVLAAAKARIERGFEDTVRFDLVVRFCEQLGKTTKHDKRRELIARMFATWRGDKFVLMRLLLPHLDKERQSYGMKESVLARMYVDLLTIAVTSDHARQLLQWKRPSSGRASGDFAAIVEQALHSRLKPTSTLTVGDLNRSLDQLARAVDRADKKAVLNHLLLNSTAREQKWIVRIVLKELKLGVSEKTFLKAFHVDAEEYFNITSSLRKVCDTLIDPAIRLPRSSGIALFHPVKPMLASRSDIDAVPKLMRNGPFGIELKYDGERIQVHKDGNTIRLFTRRANEYTDKYITLIPKLLKHIVPSVRNCIIDGELMVWDTVSGAFEQFGHLKTFANYDKSRRGFEDDDDDRSGGGNVNTDEEALMVGKQYCYVAFDILYINDKPLCDLQLRVRRELLRKATTTTAHEFELTQMTEATTKEEIVEALDLAISNREEGIMVKDLASVYVPNDRGQRWIKIKPEYIQGVGDDFDLLILGGFYGSGKRSGVFSGFLVGASVPDPEQEHALAAARASAAAAAATSAAAAAANDEFAPDAADLAPIVPPSSAHPKMFYSVAKVATGYSIQRLKGLNRVLEAHWHAWDPKNPPKHLTLGVSGAEVPDRWIDPKYSKVLQIKAAQVAQTTKYGSGFTLRFPRVTKIRYDKHWYDCMTLSEFQQVAHTHDGRYARRTVVELASAGGGAGDGAGGPRGRKRRAPGGAGGEGAATSLSARQRMLLPSVAAADVSDVRAASQIFAAHEFCVYSGDAKSPNKQELERLIVANGGTVVQEPLASTYAVIAGLKRTVKIRNLETYGRWNIIIYTWVTESVRAGEMLELEPAHMIFTNAKQRQRFTIDIDEFGDSYTHDTRPDELQRIMAKAEPFAENKRVLTPTDKCVVEESVWKNDRPWQGMFRPFLFYIDVFERVEMAETATADELIESGDEKRLAERPRIRHSPLELSERLAKFYGARVVSAITRDVSHIIVDADDRARMSDIRRACRKLLGLPRPLAKHVVRSQWIDDCVSSHEAWDETQYIVRDGGGVSRLASQVSGGSSTPGAAVHESQV